MKRLLILLFVAASLAGFAPKAFGAKQASPVFYHTENSDDWVSHSIHLQHKYSRVLVVDGSGHSPRQISVPSLNLISRKNVNGAPTEYTVFATYKSLQEAADASRGGDLI